MSSITHASKIFKVNIQVILFLLIGAIGLLTELAILKGLLNLGIFYLIAELFGGIVSILINYFGLRTWVFKTGLPPCIKEFLKYLGSVSFMVALNFILLIIGVELIGLEPFWAKLCAVPILAVFSFFIKKKFVFNQ